MADESTLWYFYLMQRKVCWDSNLREKSDAFRELRDTIYEFYWACMRALPWRCTEDPYFILVSEFMLQQTQVERVLGKYESFIETFPDFQVLARAPLKDVLSLWQGLGYNRRAVSLWKTARKVVEEFHGSLPDTQEELVQMPGIGRATAGSILAFAFNRPAVFIETNIRRVFIHFFFQGRTDVRDSEIVLLVEAAFDHDNPRQWYYALMDYGAMLGRQSLNPNRRSAHYARQAPFEGSDRQARGRVIKALLEKDTHTGKTLSLLLNIEADRLRRILAGLERDGLIAREGNSYRLP